MGTLYLVATPIGNLKDITLRALEMLKAADMVYAEDTRVAKKLLAHYGISTPLRRYDEHSHARAVVGIIRELKEGKMLALVADAGTPVIADPGARLVAEVRHAAPDVVVIPLPGPSALTTALSAAGIPAEHFTFLGYPPHKKGRESFFKDLAALSVRPVVLYESPHRIEKTLDALARVLGADREIFIARELTKIHEELWRGDVTDARAHFGAGHARGEFVIVVR